MDMQKFANVAAQSGKWYVSPPGAAKLHTAYPDVRTVPAAPVSIRRGPVSLVKPLTKQGKAGAAELRKRDSARTFRPDVRDARRQSREVRTDLPASKRELRRQAEAANRKRYGK